MSAIPAIIGAAVFLIAISVIFSIFKSIFKVVLMMMSFITILIVIGGGFVAADLKEFKENFPTSEKKVILKDGDVVLTGFVMTNEKEEPKFFSQEDVFSYSTNLIDDDLDAVLGDSYKLMIFDIESFESIGDTVELQGREFEKEFLISVLRSDDPASLMKEKDMNILFSDDISLKGNIFGTMFNEILDNPLYFFREYKNGNLFIYPETSIFKAIKFMPLGLVKTVIGNVISKIEDKIPI